MARKSVSKFKRSGVKKPWMEKKKAFAVKILGGISKWLHVGKIPIFLFSSISNIGGIYYENKRIKQNCL